MTTVAISPRETGGFSWKGWESKRPTDLLILGEPCILNIIFDDPKRPFHPLTDEIRRRHEGSGYSGSAVVREMRDRIY